MYALVVGYAGISWSSYLWSAKSCMKKVMIECCRLTPGKLWSNALLIVDDDMKETSMDPKPNHGDVTEYQCCVHNSMSGKTLSWRRRSVIELIALF